MLITDLKQPERNEFIKFGKDMADLARTYLSKDTVEDFDKAVGICDGWLKELSETASRNGSFLYPGTRFFFPNRAIHAQKGVAIHKFTKPDDDAYFSVCQISRNTYGLVFELDTPIKVVYTYLRNKFDDFTAQLAKRIPDFNYLVSIGGIQISREYVHRLGISDPLNLVDFYPVKATIENLLDNSPSSKVFVAHGDDPNYPCWSCNGDCDRCHEFLG